MRKLQTNSTNASAEYKWTKFKKPEEPTRQYRSDETWPEKENDNDKSNDTLILEPDKLAEKPDSTTDLVVDAAHPSPSDSPLVTSSQSIAPSPQMSDELDDDGASAGHTFEERCFESYVSLRNWGPYLESSKCYCAECEILFATENAIAAHNMADHSHLEEVSVPEEYQETKKYVYGSKQENSIHQCDKCAVKFTRFYNLKKHKVAIHGEMLGETNYPDVAQPRSVAPKVVSVQTVSAVPTTVVKVNKAPTENNHLCQVCNTTLPTKEELIAHLYNHVTSQYKCEFCNALFSQKIQLENHLFSHIRNRLSSSSSAREGGISNSTSSTSVVTEPSAGSNLNPRPIKALTNTPEADELSEFVKCLICATCFKSAHFYRIHMLRFHQKRVTSVPDRAKVTKLHCQQCNLAFAKIKFYNCHIQSKHIHRWCNSCKKKIRGNMLQLHNKECPNRMQTNSAPSAAKVKPQPSKNVLKVGTKLPNSARNGVKLTDSHLKVHFLFKCTVCNETFATYKSAWRHKDRHHPGAKKVIVRDTQKLILKKTATTQNVGVKPTPQIQGKVSNTGKAARKVRILLNVILQCQKCDFAFPTWSGANHHNMLGCGSTHYYTCNICHFKFYRRSMRSHAQQHQNGEKLTIVKLDEYESNNHRILHHCTTCQLYMTSKQAIIDHLSSGNTNKSQTCSECGYRISAVDKVYARHLKSHKEYDLSKSDYIIFRYSHTNQSPREIAGSCKKTNSTSKTEKFSATVVKSGETRTLIQCNTCKRHMTRKAAMHKNKMCRFTSSYICPKCGLSFTSKSIKNHSLEHKYSPKPLTFRDFDVTNYSGKKVMLDAAAIVRSLHKCKCGVVSHSETELNVHKRKYGTAKCDLEESVKCEICDVTFLKNAYTWHLMLHEGSPKKTATVKKGPRSLLSYVRCDKCHVHIMNKLQSIRKHESYDCGKSIRRVCLECGLVIPNKSQALHDNLHKSIQFTMKDLEILRMSDMKPVSKEICGFPHCHRCGLRTDGRDQHHRYRCSSDESPKTTCQTCGLTFTDNVYKLHFPYYGCDERSQMRKRKASEMDDSAEITKLISNYNKMDQAWSQVYQCTECEVLVDSYDEVIKHCEHHQSPNFEVAAFVCHVCDLNFDYVSFQRHKEQHFTRPGIERSCFEVLEFQPSKYKTACWQLYQNAFTGNKVSYQLKQEGPEQHTLYQCAKCKCICAGKIAAYEHTTKESCSAASKVCNECGLNIQSNSVADHEKYHQTNPYLTSSSFRIFWFIKDVTETNEPSNEVETLTVSDSSRPVLYKCAKCQVHYPSLFTANKHRHPGRNQKRVRNSLTPCAKCGLSFTTKSLKLHNVLHHARVSYQRSDFLIKLVRSDAPNQDTRSQFDRRLNVVPKNHIAARKNKIIVRKNQVVIRKNPQAEKRAIANGNIKNKLVLGVPGRRVAIPDASLGLPYRPVEKSSPTLYKCAHCDLHFMTYSTVFGHATYDHIRGIPSKKKVCPKCNLAFRHASYIKHVFQHHQKADYKAEDFDIFVISSDKTFKVIPCETRADTVDIGSDSDRTVSAANDIDRSVENTVKIQQNNSHNRTKVELYKCSSCDAHFLTEPAIEKHFDLKVHSTADNMKCAICNYHFKYRSLRQHAYIHHKLRNVATDDFEVVVKTPQYVKAQEKPQSLAKLQQTVFKCAACVACFINLKTIANHGMHHKAQQEGTLKQCELCKLHFGIRSIRKHMNYHHPNGADGNFKVVEVQPGEVNSALIRKYGNMMESAESTEDNLSVSGQSYESVEFLDEGTETASQNQDSEPARDSSSVEMQASDD